MERKQLEQAVETTLNAFAEGIAPIINERISQGEVHIVYAGDTKAYSQESGSIDIASEDNDEQVIAGIHHETDITL